MHALVRDSGLLSVLQVQPPTDGRDDAYLDRRIENDGSNVSGGQKQVIMFVRTLVLASARHRKDMLFILDEPHTALERRGHARHVRSSHTVHRDAHGSARTSATVGQRIVGGASAAHRRGRDVDEELLRTSSASP